MSRKWILSDALRLRLSRHVTCIIACISAVAFVVGMKSGPVLADDLQPLAIAIPGDDAVSIITTSIWTAEGYNLYRSTTSGGEGATPYQTGWYFYDTGVTNGQIYYYQVSYIDSSGNESPRSPEFTCRPSGSPPPFPSAMTYQNADGSYFITWPPVAGASGYAVTSDIDGVLTVTNGLS